jgi:large-conductance mechanosensitive channel
LAKSIVTFYIIAIFIFIFGGTNEEIHCEEQRPTKDPTIEEHQQALKET